MHLPAYIAVDPAVCHGQPCFRGTRVLVHLVLDMLAAGESTPSIVKDAYPQLTPEHIEAALQYAAQMAREGHLVTLPPEPNAVPR